MKWTPFPQWMGYIALPSSESQSPMTHSLALADVVKEVAELTSGLEIEGVHYNVCVVYMQLCVVIGIGKPCKYLTCISLSAIPVAVFLPWGGLEVFGPSHRGRLCQQSIRLHLVQVPLPRQIGYLSSVVHHQCRSQVSSKWKLICTSYL